MMANLINKKNRIYFLTFIVLIAALTVFSIVVTIERHREDTAAFEADRLLHAKNIALTFDGGPFGTSTLEVLDILKQKNVHATFFLLGKHAEKYPDIAEEIVADGNVIGNHSYDHSEYLAQMASSSFEANLGQSEQAIFKATGLKPRFFRPPYGNVSGSMIRSLASNGYDNIMWDIDTRDWDYQNTPTKTIMNRILANARPNAIILFHDGRTDGTQHSEGNTLAALSQIIDQLKARGYTFVTVDSIIKEKPYFIKN